MNAFEVLHNNLRENNLKSEHSDAYSLGWSTNQLSYKLVYTDIVFPGLYSSRCSNCWDRHRRIALYTGKCFQRKPIDMKKASPAKTSASIQYSLDDQNTLFPSTPVNSYIKEVYLNHHHLQSNKVPHALLRLLTRAELGTSKYLVEFSTTDHIYMFSSRDFQVNTTDILCL